MVNPLLERAYGCASVVILCRRERALHRGDVLAFAVEIETPIAALAADSRVAAAAEGRGKLAHEEAIHPYGSRPDLLRKTHRAFLVPAEDHRSESVCRSIRELDRFIFVAERLPGEDWAEHLVLHDFLFL